MNNLEKLLMKIKSSVVTEDHWITSEWDSVEDRFRMALSYEETEYIRNNFNFESFSIEEISTTEYEDDCNQHRQLIFKADGILYRVPFTYSSWGEGYPPELEDIRQTRQVTKEIQVWEDYDES